MDTPIATSRPGRRYFLLRSIAAAIDCSVLTGLCFAYIYHFGTETDGSYEVNGCGHVLALFALWVAWLPLPEAVFGKTFGKWACDLRVVKANDGAPITVGQAFARRMLDVADWSFFGLVGFVVAKTNPLNQRVGDLVAKTRVIEDR